MDLFSHFREIEKNRQFTIEQMAIVHETLNAFQIKFESELEILAQDLNEQITEEAEIVRQVWSENHERMGQLEEMMSKECDDRTAKRYYEKNKKKIITKVTQWQKDNPIKVRSYKKSYYGKNKQPSGESS